MKKGILICGLNGSGKSTLGSTLAKKIDYTLIDMEDCYFEKANDYEHPRSKKEAEDILLDKIQNTNDFVFVSTKANYSKEILSYIDLIVFLQAPAKIRLKRVKQRSLEKFGSKILEGGLHYKQEQDFFSYVLNREESEVLDTIKNLTCPIITLDGTKSIAMNINKIIKQLG